MFDIETPSREDAHRIAEIHVLAMDSNPLLHAQFPTDEGLAALVEFLARDTVQCLDRSDKGVVVARDRVSGDIVSFAKWSVTNGQGDIPPGNGDDQWPVECVREYIEQYTELAERVKDKVMGTTPFYHLTFVCTHPQWRGRGAGTTLMRHIQSLATSDGLPIYLESTTNAVALYQRLGFAAVDGFQMLIPKRGAVEPSDVYEEVCFLWQEESAASQI